MANQYIRVQQKPPFDIPIQFRDYRPDPAGGGAGTLAIVKKFDSPDGSSSIIIKKIPDHLKPKDKAQRVLRLLNCLSIIKHENIVKLLGTYKVADGPDNSESLYLITNYCGRPLMEVISEGRYSMEDAKKWMRELLSAIQCLHSNRVIYRNLEPENICIDANNKLTLIGFGNARVMDANKILTRNRGVEPYMPVELMLQWKGAYNETVDIWSATTILLEMLTGQAIFGGEHVKNSLKLQMEYCGPIDEEVLERMQDNTERRNLELYSKKVERQDFIEILRAKMLPGRGIGDDDILGCEDALRDFIEHTLQFNPRDRMSAEQCLAHRFLLDLQPWEVDLPKDDDQAMAALAQLIDQELDASPNLL